MRMIDADALQELCNRRIQDTWNSGTAPVSWAEAYADFKDDIDSIPTLTPPNEPERAGLYGKYTVYKNKDGSLVTDCFILRPAKDPAAVIALRSYAAATDNAELSADIINWVGAEPNESLTIEQLLKMDGQPVYVVFRPDNSGDKPQFWALVSADKQHDEVYLLDSMGGAGSYDEIWANLEAIYRRPPEGGDADHA